MTPPDDNAATVDGEVVLHLVGATLAFAFQVPVAAAAVSDVPPDIHRLTDRLVDLGVVQHAAFEHSPSCAAGCSASCHFAVPVAPAEARALADHVAALPEPRRSVIRERFADGRAPRREVHDRWNVLYRAAGSPVRSSMTGAAWSTPSARPPAANIW